MTDFKEWPRSVCSQGIAIIISITTSYGCATIPEGDLQLGPKIVRDMKASRTTAQALNKGRPIYIEAYSYPQMLETGDIWAGGPLLINLGREDISLDVLIAPALPIIAPISTRKRAPDVKKMEVKR
jgi:hypothetical protein